MVINKTQLKTIDLSKHDIYNRISFSDGATMVINLPCTTKFIKESIYLTTAFFRVAELVIKRGINIYVRS